MRTQEDRWKEQQDGEKRKGGDNSQAGKTVKDGREEGREEEEDKKNTPPRRCAGTKCWMNRLPSALTIANKGQRKRGGGRRGRG